MRRARVGTLLMLMGLFISSGPSAVASPGDAVWVSCDSCGLSQASVIAENKAPHLVGYGHLLSSVYVASLTGKQLYKFDVATDREPGLYSRNVWPASVEPSVQSGQAALWNTIPAEKIIDIPPDRSGSAANYIRNPVDRSSVYHFLSGGASGFWAQVRSMAFTGTVYAQQAIAALGADRGPTTLTLRFQDGSSIKVQVTTGVDGQTSALDIVKVDIVPDSAVSADGFPLPTQASGFAGYEAQDLSPATVDLLSQLLERFGLNLIRICGNASTRFKCDSDGRCELVHQC